MRHQVDLLFPPYRLNPREDRLFRGDTPVPLRAKPFALLRYMAEHPQRLVKHEELRKAIWPTTYVSDGVLRVYLREVRAALEDEATAPQFIETVAHRGYRFLPAVEIVAGAAASTTVPAPSTSPMVGRVEELKELNDAFARACAGRREVVFVSGEAGIGKSALIGALLSQIATHDGVRIGRGQCVEHRGESEPYLPVLDALRSLCQPDSDVVIPAIRKYAPTWLAQMPGVIEDDAFADLQQKVGGSGQQRMLREIAEALEQISAHLVVVLALEDLHWSDPSTLTLLDWLARRTQPAQLLIVGTHRPVAALPGNHPLRTLVQELAGRLARELTVGALTVTDVATYLQRQGEVADQNGSSSIEEVAHAIHARTDGNPLFMVLLVSALLSKSESRARQDIASATPPLSLLEKTAHLVPRNIAEIVSEQLGQLEQEEQQLLELAAVGGVEFCAAAIAAAADLTVMETENRCARLARLSSFLQDAGDEEWPDGSVSGRFRFNHALCRDVVYARLTSARRTGLHLSIGKRIESAYLERVSEIAPELARHFEQGRDFERALKYREQAAARALKQSAPREAIEHLNAGLTGLQRLADGPERKVHELHLHIGLGAALQSTKGYGAPEVEQAYERAGDLCRQLGETPELFPALMGLWSFAIGRGDWKRGHDLAERNLRLAEQIQQPGQLARAWRALGHGQLFLGRYEDARKSLERAIAWTADSNYLQDTFAYTSNTAVDARSALAWVLELLGFSDQALGMLRKSMTVAEQLENMHDLTYATYFGTVLYGFRREWDNVQSWARRTIELATQHGLPYFEALGTHMRGTALAQQGNLPEGLPLMSQAIAMTRAIGVEAGLSGMYLMIAETCLQAGQLRSGLDAVSDAAGFAKSKDEHIWESELHRIKGELLLAHSQREQGAKSAKRGEREVEECFLLAREVACAQGSRKWALRAAMSLSNLWRQQEKRKEARQVLTEAYNSFTEGFASRDLQEAKALLAQLH